MKAITERVCKAESGLVGGLRTVCRQHFQIEASDVGAIRKHYLGYNHRDYKLTQADVGKTIEVMSDHGGWTCWSFTANQ